MGAGRHPGASLWYLKIEPWVLRGECAPGRDSSLLLPEATELAHSYSSAAQEKVLYPVRIYRALPDLRGENGTSVPAALSGQENVMNAVLPAEAQSGDSIDCPRPIAVSAYEEVVAVASSHHVYVTSLMYFGKKLEQCSNGNRLAEYVKFAEEDEKTEHVLTLIEVCAVPQQVPISEAVVSVACGAEHLLLSTSTGRVYSMGSNRYGQLGREYRESGFCRLGEVFLVEGSRSYGGGIGSPAAVAVYAGANFSFVIARRYYTPAENTTFTLSGCTTRPAEDAGSRAKPSARMSCLMDNQLSVPRQARATGRSGFASPPATSTVPHASSATLLSVDTSRDSVASGKGEFLYSWGCNAYGQLGHGTKETALSPVEVLRPPEILSWECVAAGAAHAVIITGSHTVYSCGLNLHGQLGLETTNEEIYIKKIDLPERVQQVSCGTWHTLFLTFSGQLLTAGRPPEFPYASWLHSDSSASDLINVQLSHVGADLRCGAGKTPFVPTLNTPIPKNASDPDGGGQLQMLSPHFQVRADQHPQIPAFLKTSQSILLSTTRQLLRNSADLEAPLQLKKSLSSKIPPAGNIPFAHAPGVLRIKGFREDLISVCAGPTMNTAVGFSEQTNRCHLYMWKAAEPREHAENWIFVSEVYDASLLSKVGCDGKRVNVVSHCAASGVYLWTEPPQICSYNYQL